jgi:hypothetical protein
VRRLGGLAIIGLMTLGSLTIAGLVHPIQSRAAAPDTELYATLDGRPIPLEDVGRYYCDDFAYPEIRCSSTKLLAGARAALVTLLTAIDYVTIFDQPNYGGVYMNVSQDYSALTLIGWNDRISSFKGRNSETGTFYVDWFYGSTAWAFCCNTQTPGLGNYNNTFSSIRRT